MAEIQEAAAKQKGGKKKFKRVPAHVDMTPMVDLMCILITFFMLTTAFTKPKIMEIVLPEKIKKDEKNVEPPKIAKSRTLNVILGPENKVFWYPGIADDPKNLPPLQETDFSPEGIRKVLLERNRALFRKVSHFNDDVIAGKIDIPRDSLQSAIRALKRDDDTGPIVLIKAYEEAKYANFVDIIDEMSICDIARYTFVDMNWIEEIMIKNALGIPTASGSSTSGSN
jgi:biopolymer transport protein ExbD